MLCSLVRYLTPNIPLSTSPGLCEGWIMLYYNWVLANYQENLMLTCDQYLVCGSSSTPGFPFNSQM